MFVCFRIWIIIDTIQVSQLSNWIWRHIEVFEERWLSFFLIVLADLENCWVTFFPRAKDYSSTVQELSLWPPAKNCLPQCVCCCSQTTRHLSTVDVKHIWIIRAMPCGYNSCILWVMGKVAYYIIFGSKM